MSPSAALLAEVAPFGLLALAGSAHCAGMCGGFSALVAAEGRSERRRFLPGQLVYVAGKTATYVTLGLALSLAARALRGEPAQIAGWAEAGFARRSLAWFTGAALLFLGLRTLGLLPRWTAGPLAAPARLLARPFAHVRRLGGLTGAFGVGLLTGLLPCGLSWAALLLSLSVHPAAAVLGLATFGLATAPALLAVGGAGALLVGRARATGMRLAGPLLIVLGLLVVWRGGFGLAGDPSAGHGSCCDTAVSAANESKNESVPALAEEPAAPVR